MNNYLYIVLVGILIINLSCRDRTRYANDINHSPSLELFAPNLYTSTNGIRSLDVTRGTEDIPQYFYEKKDTTIVFSMNPKTNQVLSEIWRVPIDSTIEGLENFLRKKGVNIIAHYKNETHDVDQGEEKIQYYPEALKFFAVQASNNLMFKCRRVEIEDSTFLIVEFNYPTSSLLKPTKL